MVIFYKKWKTYNEIQLTKNKMYLNILKMTNHPPSHDQNTVTNHLHYKVLQKVHMYELHN